MKKHPNLIVIVFFLLINTLFFYQIFLKLVPLPLDNLVGVNFPWLDYKWGYPTGVPVKNPGLSDVFNTLYTWRALSADLIKSGQLPLWNVYALSGSPLLANLQSAPFYPLNFGYYLFNNIWGYTTVIFLQPFLSMSFMYLFLKEIKLGRYAAIGGSIVFAFSGFMLVYMELATASQSFLWFPLIFYLIEKYLKNTNDKTILFVPVIVLFSLLAGHLQAFSYGFIFAIFYLFFRGINVFGSVLLTLKAIFFPISLFLTGIILSLPQLLPTIELLGLSIREADHNIIEYGYGLLPIQNLITFIAPDFFGNPATYNFWGFLGYQEVTIYFGVVSLSFFILSLFSKDFNFYKRFFWISFLISILFIFNTYFGKVIYELEVPIFSSSYASRLILILNFATAVLVGIGLQEFMSNLRKLKIIAVILFLTNLILIACVFYVIKYSLNFQFIEVDENLLKRLNVGLRNLIFPAMLLFIFSIGILFVKNIKVLKVFVIILIIGDLFRFGLKFTPFTDIQFDYPKTPVISYLQDNLGYFRFDKESGPIIPSDTWIPYRLMTPSGYDPLITSRYSNFYQVYNGNEPGSVVTRYANLAKSDTKFLDLLGVKYLVIGKKDKLNVISKEATKTAEEFNIPRFKHVFEDKTLVIVENQDVLPRVNLFDNYLVSPTSIDALHVLYNGLDFKKQIVVDKQINGNYKKSELDKAYITNYQANQVNIKVWSKDKTILMLTDTYYPGWKAFVNGVEKPVLLADGVFRAVEVPGGENEIVFKYLPNSFYGGLKISFLVLILYLIFVLIRFKKV